MPSNAELVQQLKWHKFPVLDDGFVCLVDVMGDDEAVVQAALKTSRLRDLTVEDPPMEEIVL